MTQSATTQQPGADTVRYEKLNVYCIWQIRGGERWYYTGELRNGVADFVPQKDDAMEMDRDEANSEFASLKAQDQLPQETEYDEPAEIVLLHTVRVPKRSAPSSDSGASR